MDRRLIVIFHLITRNANTETGIMVNDQTMYPRVGGKDGLSHFSGISVSAPHSPHSTGTAIDSSSHLGSLISLCSGRPTDFSTTTPAPRQATQRPRQVKRE